MKKLVLTIAAGFMALGLSAQTNLLNDGGFSKDTIFDVSQGGQNNQWGAWSDNGGAAKVENGVCIVTPVTHNDVWRMQIEQKGLALENGKSYVITFKAWADAARTIQITLEDPNNGYRLIGITDDPNTVMGDDNIHNSKWNVDITTEPATYTLHVMVDRLVSNTLVKFAFLLAQTSDVVYLDDVSFVEDAGGTAVKSAKQNTFSFYPNPAKNILFVNAKAGKQINIYNVAGSLVFSKIAASGLEKIDVSSLPAGVYFIKVDGNTQKLMIK
ncbi:MAG: T9SS type A sorting domain-containing protein [Bacteroidales bacterium]|nr:T9SS type A sorting domain-containing protein [Bacteroidales bacterium]